MVTVFENELDGTSSNSGRGWLHLIKRNHSRERYESNFSPSGYGQIVGQIGFFNLGIATGQGEWKLWIQTQDIYIYIYIYMYILSGVR